MDASGARTRRCGSPRSFEEANKLPELITLEEDGPLGNAGDQVWVDDPADVKPTKKAAAKKPAANE